MIMTQGGIRKSLILMLKKAGDTGAIVSGLRPMVSHVQKPSRKEKRTLEALLRPPVGYVTLRMPEEACKDLEKEGDAWFIVRVKREVIEGMERQTEAGVIVPPGVAP